MDFLGIWRRGGACPSRIPQGKARVDTGRASHGPYHRLPGIRRYINPCRSGGTPHLFTITYYFLLSKNPGQAEGKVNSEEGISKNPERESVRDFSAVRMEGVT